MPHSLVKIWIHGIWGTKSRLPLIKPGFEQQLHIHIKEHLEKDLGCRVYSINGTEDHIHVLFLMNPKHPLLEIIKNIKGESSHWINRQSFMQEKFSWQLGYGAFSVSESRIKIAEKYIAKQKEHHKKTSYADEVRLFLKMYGLVNR